MFLLVCLNTSEPDWFFNWQVATGMRHYFKRYNIVLNFFPQMAINGSTSAHSLCTADIWGSTESHFPYMAVQECGAFMAGIFPLSRTLLLVILSCHFIYVWLIWNIRWHWMKLFSKWNHFYSRAIFRDHTWKNNNEYLPLQALHTYSW